MKKIWTCKIGESEFNHHGMDAPMRQAVREAYYKITGQQSDFIFSSWGGELNERERALVKELCSPKESEDQKPTKEYGFSPIGFLLVITVIPIILLIVPLFIVKVAWVVTSDIARNFEATKKGA